VIKGLIFDIKRFSVNDGPGIRTTVFFKGCPLSCWWCHNPESRSPEPVACMRNLILDGTGYPSAEITGIEYTVQEIIAEVAKDRIFYDESEGGVTLSGGEPLFQPGFCISLLKSLDAEKYHTALDTSGYADPDLFVQTFPFTRLFLFDIKIPDEEKHLHYTGVPLNPILENLRLAVESGKEVIIRYPVVPGVNDTRTDIDRLKNILKGFGGKIREIHLLPYHASAAAKYRRFGIENRMDNTKSLDRKDLEALKDELLSAGLKVLVGGI
jgi:pyruvate formate lyase activating enzyme